MSNKFFYPDRSPLRLTFQKCGFPQTARLLILIFILMLNVWQGHAADHPPIEAKKPVVATLKPAPAELFKQWDRNGDGKLNQEEYLSGQQPENQAQAKRDFKVSDFDGNNSLSLDEFQTISGIVPAAERKPVLDPVTKLAAAAKKKWQSIIKSADADSDGLLSVEEWPSKVMEQKLPAFAALPLQVWDQDQNGLVSAAEAEHLLDIAYGIKHLDGTPLRSDNGWVLYRSYFKRTDKNEDLQLSKKEYLPSIRWTEEKVLALFQELDLDHNENLSLSELKNSQTSYIDEFAYFLRSDLDLDGLLSKDELLKIGINGATEQRLAHTLPAFDADGDGKYSLEEFRLSPTGCSYVTLQIYGRRDGDHDARLSWQEFYSETSPQLIGLAWELFSRLDQNETGFLEMNEFDFQIDPAKLSPEKAFTACDKDQDQELNREEYLTLVANQNLKTANRNFQVVDFDQNKKLSFAEFQTLPSLFSRETRGAIPDPIADLAKQAHQTWQTIQQAADQNSDGQLSSEEWPLKSLQKQLPPLAELEFQVWDADQNGLVSATEAEQLVDVAFGMKHINGAPLRDSRGRVLYRSYILPTDKNHDQRLSKEEYVPSIRLPEKEVLELFNGMDADQNGFLTFPEMMTSRNTYIDEFEYFLSRDRDLDGLLSSAELLKFNSNDATPLRLPQGLAAFDSNGDGKLSLTEFRLAPVGISYVTMRVYGRKDLNHDAKLSWQEFYVEPSPQVIGLAWELFTRFDRNKNGQLELNEFEFQIDTTKMSPENAFTACDRNQDQELTLEEYTPLAANLSPALRKRNFQVCDFNANGRLSFAEYQTMPDIFSAEKRAAIPDPIAELAKQSHQEWEKIQKAADQNSDGLISPAEWPEKQLRKQWPPLAELEFSSWDTNQDGQVSQQEARQLLDIAYGMKHVDGSDLRSENGWVVYRSYFTGVDKNKDHRLSKQEYLPSIRWPEEKVLALFQELDVDKNESLSIQELKKSTTSYIDEFNFFLRTDKDLDGLLSPEEMGEVNSNDRYPKRLKLGMAAFDTNGDGKFSLKEFRLSPVGCFYVTLRLSGQKDQDHDARLSWQEFYTEPAPQLMGVLWEQFKRYDRNQNGFLEPDEYEFQIIPSKLTPEKAFAFSDKNGDQHLEQEEYLAQASNLSPKLAKRNFHFVDYNGDQKLSLKEYQTLPNLFPPEKRAAVPDPIADLAMSAQQRWRKISKAADQNTNGLLTEDEWPQAELKKQLPPLEKISFSSWDQDGNGEVTEKEARQLIDVAYGMKHVDGSSLRNPNGQVLYRFYIQRTDKNGDHRLSKEEYLPSIRLPKEKVEELFTQMDADKDGFLTYPEMRRTSNTNIDEFAYFLSRDSDLDGLLSAEELLKFNSNDSTPKRLPQGMAAFDEDGDGKLSLSEYRLAPVGISYVTLRVYDRIDTNLDARLSWEEFYAEPAPQLIGLAWELFSRYDRDQSGQLELDEFEFRIDSSKMSPENAFTACDQDQNGTLSEEEFLSTIPQARLKSAQRDFHLVDFDNNGQLSFTEYQTLPDLFPPEKRGPVPDPVVELASAAQQTCVKIFKAADANADGQLSESEWPLKELTQKLPPLSEVKFRDWDRNQDSQISEQEVQDLIDIAYGLKHVTGAPLRTPDGRTLYRSYITYADKNGDNLLSREEYIPSIRRPKEQVLSLFEELDVNRDGSLDYIELSESHLSNIDELKFFQRSDTDFDGLLSVEELAKVNSNDSTRERIPQGMAAFDSNQDGHFSLKEFRLSPMGCNYVTLRVYGRQDKDHDGQLSWNEFYTESSPQLIGLSWELFKRYDRNNNGQLELDEIEFRYNPAKIPPDKYFAVADLNGDGKLTFEEVFTDSVPEQSDVRAYRSYQIRLARAEDKFFQDDQNQDQSLDLDEYIKSHKAAELIAERHRRAVGRTTADDGSKWLFPVLGTLNVILLVGVAIFFLRRKTSQGSK